MLKSQRSFLEMSVLIGLVVICFAATSYGKQITCACTTAHCKAQGTDRCNSTSLCFTQFLLQEGSDPISRGCIFSSTPLLCENRRPAVSSEKWPILVCCSQNLCNLDTMPPTPPGWAEAATSSVAPSTTSTGAPRPFGFPKRPPAPPRLPSPVEPKYRDPVVAASDAPPSASNPSLIDSTISQDQSEPFGSPLYIVLVVLVLTLFCIVGCILATFLRRQAALFDTSRYDHRHPYYKNPSLQRSPLDPEMNSPNIYDNKIAVTL